MNKTIIGYGKCPSCGHKTKITQTKTGGGYLMCQNIRENGKYCGTRVNYAPNSAFIENILKNSDKNTDEKTTNEKDPASKWRTAFDS